MALNMYAFVKADGLIITQRPRFHEISISRVRGQLDLQSRTRHYGHVSQLADNTRRCGQTMGIVYGFQQTPDTWVLCEKRNSGGLDHHVCYNDIYRNKD